MEAGFYIAGGVAVAATVLAITRLNAIHALLYLIVSLLAVAVVFFCLGAPFVAAIEVIVYAGAIMVLFVFVVMMLNLGPPAVEMERRWLTPRMWTGPAILAAVLIAELAYLLSRSGPAPEPLRVVGPIQVSVALLGRYLIGVELASILLMGGLVGAYHLGRTGEPEVEIRDDTRADESRIAARGDLVRVGTDRPADAAQRDIHADVH